MRKSVSDDRIIRERSRAFIPDAREPKKIARRVSTRGNANFAGLPHGGNTKSSGDTVINNGKYKKACKVNGGNFQDAVNWSATFKGKTIKNYCPWVHEQKNPGTYCKQKQNNVLVSTACPCACAGY